MNKNIVENELSEMGIKIWNNPGTESLGTTVKETEAGLTVDAHSLCMIDGKNRRFLARRLVKNSVSEVIDYMKRDGFKNFCWGGYSAYPMMSSDPSKFGQKMTFRTIQFSAW